MRDARSVGSGREILVEAMEVMEATLTLKSAPALVGRPEPKPVADLDVREVWPLKCEHR